MLRGEVHWASVPTRGPSKRRPMLIVSDDVFNRNPRYPKVMVVHLTSVRRVEGPFDWEVTVPKGTAGLQRPSTIKCAEVYTLWKDQLLGTLGTLPRATMEKVDRALAIALSLPLPRIES
jgi:mRNA-degrading endonuclease toxin of MazEF toxin-antitoxin module